MKNQWLNKEEYPFESRYYNINNLKLHYIDEGIGDVVLFVHGTPSWSFDFRNIIKGLRKKYRCIAIDHIGFGLSDKPNNYDYSTQNHSRTLEKFILSLKIENITLVVHDFGGPIGLNFAINHPYLINKLVVLNTWLWSAENEPVFKKMKRILSNPIIPFLYKYFNFSAKVVLPSSFAKHKLPKQIKSQYSMPFQTWKERTGTIGFLNSLLHEQPWFEHLWNQKSLIQSKPFLFIWGMKDPVISPDYLFKFQENFKNSKVLKLSTCGHFPQEEESELVLNEILDFL